MPRKTEQTKELVAKKLRTGEIAIWDSESGSVILIASPGKEGTITARIIRGASFKALEESLGDVIGLV